MTRVYIHGANATPNSWNYIRSQCGDGMAIAYDSHNGFRNNLGDMIERLSGEPSLEFVAHSLGGIYSLHLADHFGSRAKGGVTLSTPYGGHILAYYARLLAPWYPLFEDIAPTGWPMRTVNGIGIRWPWCNVVTTSGHVPWIQGANDGVITISSQRHKKGMDLIDISCNHYEVVLSRSAVDIIRDRLG